MCRVVGGVRRFRRYSRYVVLIPTRVLRLLLLRGPFDVFIYLVLAFINFWFVPAARPVLHDLSWYHFGTGSCRLLSRWR